MPALRSAHTPRRAGRAPSRPLLVRSALGVLLVASAVGLAACGGSGSAASSTATAAIPTTTTGGAAAAGGPAGPANRAAFTKYTTCLKQHGVTLPSFGNRGNGNGGGGAPPTGTSTSPRRGGFGGAFANPKFKTAQTACAKLLPAGFRGGFGGRGGPGGGGGFGGNSAAFAAYRNCLTLHGVKLAAGGFGRPGAGGKAPTAKQQAALKACASLRPTFTRPPTGTSTNPNTTTTS